MREKIKDKGRLEHILNSIDVYSATKTNKMWYKNKTTPDLSIVKRLGED